MIFLKPLVSFLFRGPVKGGVGEGIDVVTQLTRNKTTFQSKHTL